MRKIATLLVLGLFSLPASAQGNYPRAELFGGFSFGSIEVVGPVINSPELAQALGFQAAATLNVTEAFGIVAEVGGLWGDLQSRTFSGGTGGGTFRRFQVLAGPRFTRRTNRIVVFVHALPGFAQQRDTRMSTSFFFPPSTTISTSNGFALALGGGIDVKAGRHLSIRAVQVDYLPMRVEGDWRNSVRVGVGVVLKFGGGS
jgi:hypothetical protein